MGVPTLFKKIIHNKFYKNIANGVKDGKTDCDYLFMDYNGIVYNAYESIKKDLEGKNYDKDKIEELILEEVIRITQHIICNVLKPKKMTYIALDGPAPRAKMIQQRSRRFKATLDKQFIIELKKKFKMNNNENEGWDGSANISPGTKFMEKLSNRIISAMKDKTFVKHNSQMKIIFNNGNSPGEGEHKFLDILRNMRTMESKKNDKIYLYGRDADLIELAICTHKSNIYIIREIKAERDVKLDEIYEGYTYLELNINNLKNGFYNDIIRKDGFKEKEGILIKKKDKVRLLNDYIFLTFLAGNDFVISLPFLKIRKGSLMKIISIYQEIKDTFDDYLVLYDISKNEKPKINIEFLKEIFKKGYEKEDEWMKKDVQSEINKYLSGYMDERTVESELKLSEYDKIVTRYTHMHVASTHHPLFEKYSKDFRIINYDDTYSKWRIDFYNYYLGNHEKERLDLLIENYLESLYFTLNYYFVGCPSWSWHYKFRVAPLLGDVYSYLEEKSLSVIENANEFELSSPLTPFEQLLFILPAQYKHMLPEVLHPIMIDTKVGATQYYPETFKIDVTFGSKTMYSEAILPEIDDEYLLKIIKEYEEKLSIEDKARNVIRTKSYGN
jgi:5'-3' exonuclease